MARKLISLEGATIVVPAGWTATAGYGQFAVDGTVNNGTISSSGDVMAYLQIGYNGNFEDGQTPTANYVWGGSYGGISNSNALNITITGGDDADSESLIQWLLDNNAEITGGVYEAITQLAPFLTNIANAIRTKKGTTETINAQDFASEIESIGGGFPIYTMSDDTGYLISKAIGIIDKNGVYHEYEADFHNNNTSYNVIGSNKMIACVVSSYINQFESINSVKGLFNLSTGAVATPSNIYAGAILVLTGDAEIEASF